MANVPTNLTMHRSGESVWDRQARVNSQDRAMTAIGLLMVAAGTCLVAQAYKHQLSGAWRGRFQALRERHSDQVTKASAESFPASDPPSWTPAVGKPSQAENRQ